MTEVRITAFMNDAAAFAPAIWKTIVNGLVDDVLVERPGVRYETLRPMMRTDRI